MTTPQTPQQIAQRVLETPCLICGKPVEGYKAEYCCSGRDCNCMGLPIEPCLCSPECSKALFKHDGTMEERRIKAGIKMAPTYRQLESDLAEMREENERLRALIQRSIELMEKNSAERRTYREECQTLAKQRDDLRGKADGLAAALESIAGSDVCADAAHACDHPSEAREALDRYRAAQGVDTTPPSESSR